MSHKNDVGDPMPIRLQTSHRLMSLPSLINANYWTLSQTTMTSKCVNPETPVEIIAIIKVSGLLRSHSRELINIFSISVRSLPRNRLPPRHHSAESKQPSARRSTNCWSSASSRNLRPASGAKLTPYPSTGKVSDPESLSFYVGFDTPG